MMAFLLSYRILTKKVRIKSYVNLLSCVKRVGKIALCVKEKVATRFSFMEVSPRYHRQNQMGWMILVVVNGVPPHLQPIVMSSQIKGW